MARLKKRLPKDFEAVVGSGDLARMQAIFDTCDPNARSTLKVPALSTYGIPTELIRWLVARGADLQVSNGYGETPLHHHAGAWNGHPDVLLELGADLESVDQRGNTALFAASAHPEHAGLLLQAGAEVGARNNEGQNVLEHRLASSDPRDLDRVADTAALLVRAGVEITAEARAEVLRLGAEFEAVREVYDPESVDAAARAVTVLHELVGVAQVAPVDPHDGVSPIRVTATDWTDQYDQLWAALVPPMGAAQTVQGEVIRIVGRVFNEVATNGGVNWDDDYRTMLATLPGHLASGETLSAEQLAAVGALMSVLRGAHPAEETARDLVRHGVAWVVRNPEPVPLPAPPYRR